MGMTVFQSKFISKSRPRAGSGLQTAVSGPCTNLSLFCMFEVFHKKMSGGVVTQLPISFLCHLPAEDGFLRSFDSWAMGKCTHDPGPPHVNSSPEDSEEGWSDKQEQLIIIGSLLCAWQQSRTWLG